MSSVICDGYHKGVEAVPARAKEQELDGPLSEDPKRKLDQEDQEGTKRPAEASPDGQPPRRRSRTPERDGGLKLPIESKTGGSKKEVRLCSHIYY